MPLLEAHIESRICAYARSRGVATYKFTSPAHRGVPDRLFVFPNGRTAFLEIKRGGEEPTPLQKRELQILRTQGAPASWCDSVEAGCSLISDGLASDFEPWKDAPIS